MKRVDDLQDVFEMYCSRFKLSDGWFALGLIKREELCAHASEFIATGDRNTEHFRWKQFLEFLESRQSLGEEEMKKLYELGKIDSDRSMGESMMIRMLKHGNCSNALLAQAAESKRKSVRVAKRKSVRKSSQVAN